MAQKRKSKNGLLTDFFDVERLAETANQILDDSQQYRPLGEAAAAIIRDRYSLDVCLPQMLALYEDAVHARREGKA